MAKFQSPLLGYNNNVRHRGRVFHIQTEDSGVAHPHVITHLFMDGGRILKSIKRSYAEHVGKDDMKETVRVLMKEQHKSMVIALRDGEFDELVDGGAKRPSGGATAPVSKKTLTPAPMTDAAAPPAPEPVAQAAPPPAPPPAAPTPPLTPRRRITEDFVPPTVDNRRPLPLYAEPPLPPELEALLRDEVPPPDGAPPSARSPVPVPVAAVASAPAPSPVAESEDVEPPTTREQAPPVPAQELTLDFDALERDAGPSPVFIPTDLPPPPERLFARQPRSGAYRAAEIPTREESLAPAPPRTRSERPPPPSARGMRSRSERPPAPRPTAPPLPLKPHDGLPSRDDSIREKSLDEVILSYLSEDLDPPRK